MESSRQIEERAAAWLLQRDSGSWGDADQARLAEWLEAATLNRVAFLRLEAGWEEANRLKALGAGFPRGKVPGVGELTSEADETSAAEARTGSRITRGRLRSRLLAVAASMIAVFCLTWYAVGPPARDHYVTPIGGVSSVPLKDGSSVTLNTASEIHVQMTDAQRRVDLTQGEAFFEVARDPARPFVVQAGARRIVVVGTKFSVRREGDDIQVVVTEGAVRFQGAHSRSVSSGIAEGNMVAPTLTAGAVARVVDARITVENKSMPEVEDILSWRSGFVVFHETALADAVAEFNRYNERKILIQDPALAAMRLSGKFRSTNYETFVRLLEDT